MSTTEERLLEACVNDEEREKVRALCKGTRVDELYEAYKHILQAHFHLKRLNERFHDDVIAGKYLTEAVGEVREELADVVGGKITGNLVMAAHEEIKKDLEVRQKGNAVFMNHELLIKHGIAKKDY